MSEAALALPAETPAPIGRPRPLNGAVILIGEPASEPGGVIRAVLRQDGAAEVIWRRDLAGVEAAIAEGGIACAQIDIDLPGGDVIDLARRIRFGEIGDNPFLPILVTTPRSEGRVVLAALLAGVDDVLTKPLSAAAVALRMQRLAVARKPFVASSGYMGPIRAQMGRAFRDARQFVAPNALKAAIAGQSLDMLENDPEFVEARNRLTILRLERCIHLLAAAARGLLHGEDPAELEDARGELLAHADDLSAMISQIPLGNLQDTVRRLAALTGVAVRGDDTANRATRLIVEIAEAVASIIERRNDDLFAFPADIIRRMDARFPDLLES